MDNNFIGDKTSLIYIEDALVTIINNTCINNGYISQLVTTKVKTTKTLAGAVFNFEDYTFSHKQLYGIF